MSSYPPPPPPGYGGPTPPPPPPPPAPGYGRPDVPLYRPTDGGATAALVVGIASLVLDCFCAPLGLLAGGVALFVGLSARRRIAASAGAVGGDGLALGGVVTGAIGAGLSVLFVLIGIALFATGVVTTNGFPLPTPTP